MAMFLALGLAVTSRSRQFMWAAAGALMAIAIVMTGSRTAVAAASIVGVGLTAYLVFRSSNRVWRFASALALAIGLVAAVFAMSRTSGGTPSQAVNIRWWFLQTTWGMLTAEPLFGVGISQFGLWSRHFAAPELLIYYQPENAHNNFAQVAGELGLTGLAAFLVVLCAALRFRSDAEKIWRIRLPVLLGLAAFILTWLGGHPLLVPEVAYPFWITLGAAAALMPVIPASRMANGLIVGALACLFISVPFRVHSWTDRIDFARVQYGLSKGRMTSTRARFFVPAERANVEIPLRARAASDDQPVLVDVFVDDVMTQTVTLTDRNWQRTRVEFGMKSFPSKFRQLELRIQPAESSETAIDSRRDDIEVGNWEIITKPNG